MSQKCDIDTSKEFKVNSLKIATLRYFRLKNASSWHCINIDACKYQKVTRAKNLIKVSIYPNFIENLSIFCHLIAATVASMIETEGPFKYHLDLTKRKLKNWE